jgi:hypothetical protein
VNSATVPERRVGAAAGDEHQLLARVFIATDLRAQQ